MLLKKYMNKAIKIFVLFFSPHSFALFYVSISMSSNNKSGEMEREKLRKEREKKKKKRKLKGT